MDVGSRAGDLEEPDALAAAAAVNGGQQRDGKEERELIDERERCMVHAAVEMRRSGCS
uniref:Uncharacterized protein n=1 Tax=Peronospora matthiolae TaxID=2874970 RepID=A0AAV1UMD2_9STRA